MCFRFRVLCFVCSYALCTRNCNCAPIPRCNRPSLQRTALPSHSSSVLHSSPSSHFLVCFNNRPCLWCACHPCPGGLTSNPRNFSRACASPRETLHTKNERKKEKLIKLREAKHANKTASAIGLPPHRTLILTHEHSPRYLSGGRCM
jgi:hypothetical protein